MSDPRRRFVVDTIIEFVGSAIDSKQVSSQLGGESAIDTFLNGDGQLLAASLLQDGGACRLRISNTVSDSKAATTSGGSGSSEVYIVKKNPGAVPGEGFERQLLVTSTVDSPLYSLYMAIHNIYAPLLRSGAEIDAKIAQQLADLEKALYAVVLQRGTTASADTRESDVSAIRSIGDEHAYWTAVAAKGGHAGARATAFAKQLASIAPRYAQMGRGEFKHDDAVRLMDDTEATLADLCAEDGFSHGEKYGVVRLWRVLDVCGEAFAQFIRSSLGALNFWKGAISGVQQSITSATAMCELWEQITGDSVEWVKDERRRKDRYEEKSLKPLSRRLTIIQQTRLIGEELQRLMSKDDQTKFQLNRVFAPFEAINVLHTGPFSEPQWVAALGEFDRLLVPVEHHAASQLKSRIFALADRPQLLLAEFRNFPNLLLRRSISHELEAERETLLGQLQAHLEDIRQQFDAHSDEMSGASDRKTAGRPIAPRNSSQLVSAVVWSSQLKNKVEQSQSIVEKVLPGVNGIDKFKSAAQELKLHLDDYSKDQFKRWSDDLLEALRDKDPSLVLQQSGKLMELNVIHRDAAQTGAPGELVVHYSEKLVILLRECRQLSELGYTIPKAIQDAVATGERFYRYGLKLKQVANFYNTMGEQMIPSQMGMLLNEAQYFERVIKENKGVTWNNPEVCERYMNDLMAAAEKLTARNRKLRALHVSLGNMIIGLMDTDIGKQWDSWQDQIIKIKAVFTKEQATSDPVAIREWRAHWEQQLFKAYEVQYRTHLESLSETMPEVAVELCYAGRKAPGKLAFRPALPDLRTKYYRQLRTFIDMPKTFTGLGDASLYASIPDRCGPALALVYRAAEALFEQLKFVIKQYEPWVAFGIVDMDEFVSERLTETAEWEANFQALKAKRKDMDKLPNTVRVGCFQVSFSPFKSSVDDMMHKLSDALLTSLRRSASNDLKVANEYLNTAMERLNNRPHTVEEMTVAKKEVETIAARKLEISQSVSKLQRKAELLHHMLGVVLDKGDLEERWKQFEDYLGGFDDMLREQKDKLKEDISRRVKECQLNTEKFASKWKELKPKADVKDITKDQADGNVAAMNDWQAEVKVLLDTAKEVGANSETFGMGAPSWATLEEVKIEIDSFTDSWSLYGEYAKELDAMVNENWLAFRAHVLSFDDFGKKWVAKLKGRGARDLVYDFLSREVKGHQEIFPILRKVTGQLFEKEHWSLLFSKLKFPATVTTKTLTLRDFLEARDQMRACERDIDHLVARAQGEVSIREAVQELKVWAEQSEFALLEHKTNMGVSTVLIKEWKDLFTKVSDQQSLVASLKDSPYFPPFADQAMQIANKLGILDEVLHQMNQIQRKWVYLEPIFSRGALPKEQSRFKSIDTQFRGIMDDIKANPNIVNLATVPNLKDTVSTLLDQLDRCQRALNDFLEEKRSRFPRFYFIGDDDLLEILGQASNPAVIENHLKKLFAGIHSVEFSADKKTIIAMKSEKKEVVPLNQPVRINDEVETWLQQLAQGMEDTLAQLLVKCLSECDYEKYPEQILCLAEMVNFTGDCEKHMAAGTLLAYEGQLTKQLATLTGADTSSSRLLQTKLKALIMDLIHNIEVVRLLIDNQIRDPSDWLWHKQLRFYMKKKDGTGPQLCYIRMADAEFVYTYEYQGNAARLVHTPLTDKCYLTLTQGMFLGYGGNPFGPAGTGKTESVKALGHAFGRQVLVFNCDEGIDFQSMGRIFTGLVKSGAWGCFDEFNRLKEDQLSAISQQIQVIQAALKKRDLTTELLGKTIEVNANAAIFVTMNPASKEYGGRSKLPHNLKQLFRDVAMSEPDTGLISEVSLYAEGFKHAKIVGRKLVEIFNLSRQLLSPQRHYDWGLRALKTILGHAGQLVSKERKEAKGGELSLETETKLVIGALRINTLSKLTFADTSRFNGLLQDVFPGIKVEEIDYKILTDNIIKTLEEMKLEKIPTQIKKILELYAALQQRMGVVLVGPSGCGKTVLLNVLHGALKKMGNNVIRHVMNPKALERSVLLGYMDNDTREWFDGVLTASARAVMRAPDSHSWIMCDGDIDPEWVESLNSVLDDNHLLTMPNGERIKFGSNVNFVFESHDLQFASPATVSRMGMIFLSEEDVDIPALITSWLARQEPAMQNNLRSWMENYFHRALHYVMEQQAVVASTKVGLVLTALSHLRNVTAKGEFVVGLIRGMGSNLELDKRSAFAKEVFGWAGDRAPDPRAPLDCFWNKGTSSYMPYLPDNKPVNPDEMSVRSPPVVQTVDVQRNRDLIMPWLEHMEPTIIVGPEGCGKTLLLTQCFKRLKSSSVAIIHCSAQTAASHVMQKLEESCAVFTTSKGRVYRPREGERLVLFLKDLNLPKPDAYDTIQLIAFLQQLITYQGFWDHNREWMGVERVQIVASMNPATTVGRHQLSTRFTAITRVAFLTYPDHDQLQSVYTTFLRGVLALTDVADQKTWRAEANIRKLAGNMVDLYEKLRLKFSVDDYRHYLFNPRDLTQWVFGLLRYDLSQQNLLDVWSHESYRLFADRLVSQSSLKAFEGLLGGLLRSQWSYELKLADIYFTALATVAPASYAEKKEAKGGAAKETKASSSSGQSAIAMEMGKQLERIPAGDFKEMVTQGLYNYEREFKGLNMLLFPEILDHLAFEDRVLSRPGGSLLLIGDRGVGRRTATTLVAFMQHIRMWTPNVSTKYDLKAFRGDLKEQLKIAGVEGTRTLIYLEDHQIVDNAMYEDINSLLSAGEVPGLFTPQEMEPILSPLKEQFGAMGPALGCRNVLEFFVHRVRSNIHIVLSMDPGHPLFNVRCESNPAFYTRCTIMWMGRWSKDGMLQVPMMRLQPILSSTSADGKALDAGVLLDQVVHVHNTMIDRGIAAGGSGATPTKYIAFLETYLKIFELNQKKKTLQKKHLMGGLKKLMDAASNVEVLSKEAGVKRELAAKKQIEADQALEQITTALALAAARRGDAEKLKAGLGAHEAKLSVRKAEVAKELAEAQPALDKAKSAVGDIRKDNINEIRAFRMPPDKIRQVLAGVLTLLRQEDLSWTNMKNFLGKQTVKEQIVNFDASTITPQIRGSVMKLIKDMPDAFDYDKMYHVNVAAAPLAEWVKANLKYSAVLEQIQPLRAELEKNAQELKNNTEQLDRVRNELKELEAKVQSLKDNYGRMTGESEALKQQVTTITETLNAAQSLLGKLDGERSRWDTQVRTLSTGLDALPYNSMLAAGVITYLGGYPEDVRQQTINDWKSKCRIAEFDFESFMATESEFLKWKAEGLPSDSLSMQNGLVIINSVQCPYLIDPNTQATEWLKRHLSHGDKPVEAIMQQDPKFLTTLELAVRFGKTLIIQEADGVLPLLYPLLRRDLFRQGPRWVVQIGDKAIDYSDTFKLYLVTRDSAPDIPSSASALINEVNFTVTRSGLEGQLLGVTLEHEKPELEAKKSQLLAEEDKFKIQLDELEKELLEALATSEGNILQNKTLIESLEKTKTQSNAISNALKHAKVVQTDLDRQRDVYRPIARSGSILFFLVGQLSSVNNMYEFSLPAFIRLFNKNLDSIVGGGSGGNEKERVEKLTVGLKLNVFRYITRSLFKDDRLMFALHLIHCLHPQLFEKREWEFFTGAVVDTSADGGEAKAAAAPLPSWATADRGTSFAMFSSTFPQLIRAIRLGGGSDEATWRKWAQNPRCESDFPFPVVSSPAEAKQSAPGTVTSFQKLLVLQALRPDRLQSALQAYVCETIGVPSISPPPLNLAKIVEETQHGGASKEGKSSGEAKGEEKKAGGSSGSGDVEPILFVATAGSDPTMELEEFAIKRVGKGKFKQMAMGSGQTEPALEALIVAQREGSWLCLKNLHLVTAWLPSLEKALKSGTPHPDFRLWLTTEPHQHFPPILLQQSLKITYESPPGLKQNLLRTYESWDPSYIAQGSVTRAQMLFILAWFHAIVQERRTFIPQGWTKFYEFSFADLRSGADIIDAVCAKLSRDKNPFISGGSIPWPTIWGLLKFAIYGGRIDNDHDLRVLVTYLSRYFEKDMLSTASATGGRKLATGIDLPSSNKHGDYVRIIAAMSDADAPQLFGMAANIEGALQQTQSGEVIAQLRKLAASSALAAKFDRDQWKAQLGPMLSVWDKLVGGKDKPVLRPSTKLTKEQKMEELSPVESFVSLEDQAVHSLVTLVDSGITAINNVLYSSGLLTPLVRDDGVCLLAGKVPWRWQKYWYGPEDAGSWLREVIARKVAIKGWLERVENGSLLTRSVSLPELFRPRTFLNAMRQQTARATGKAIDSLKLTCSWSAVLLPKSATVRVQVEGLLVQGCSFTGNVLSALGADGAILSKMPPCTFAYIDKDDADPYPEKGADGNGSLAVPVYMAPSREEFVCEIRVPCRQPKEDWILSGVAIFLTDLK